MKYDTESFIEELKRVHGDVYDYSKTVFINYHKKVTVICPKHGEFQKYPHSLLQGCRCPDCLNEKVELHREEEPRFVELFNDCKPCRTCRTAPDYVYIATDNEVLPGRFKIGYSFNPQQRVRQLKSGTPFPVYLLAGYRIDHRKATQIEKQLHNFYKGANCGYLGKFITGGEWFFLRPGDIHPRDLLKLIVRLATAQSYRNSH